MKWSNPSDTRQRDKILAAAVRETERTTLNLVSRSAIAKRAKVAPSLVSYYTGTMEDLQADIVALAIKTGNVKACANCMAARHPGMKDASDALRRDAAKLLAAA